MPAPGANRIVLKKAFFTVEIEGIIHGKFTSCTEIAPEVEEIIYREGGDLAPTVKDPGLYNVPDVTLARGAVPQDSDLFDWFSEVVDFATDAGLLNPNFKKNVDVVVRDRDKSELLRYRLYDAWPKKVVVGDWDSVSEMVVESVTLSVRGVRRIIAP